MTRLAIVLGFALGNAAVFYLVTKRRAARRAEDRRGDLEWSHFVHDFTCDTGRWPHAGDCTVNPDSNDFTTVSQRWAKLGRCMQYGIGRMEDPLAAAGGLIGGGVLHIPRSMAGDWRPENEPQEPFMPRIEVIEDDDPRINR